MRFESESGTTEDVPPFPWGFGLVLYWAPKRRGCDQRETDPRVGVRFPWTESQWELVNCQGLLMNFYPARGAGWRRNSGATS